MKTALVTGATGCLGRNLVDVLLKEGWEIFVFHRRSSDLSKLNNCNVKLREVNLHNLDSIRGAMPENLNCIFHVGANLSHDPSDEIEQWKDNVLATRNLAQVACEKKVERFVFTSTGATMPYVSNDAEECNKIKSGYIRTKRLAEIELYNFMSKNLDYVILHPIIVIGKYDYNNYSTLFKLLKGGKLRRTFDGNFIFCDAEEIAIAHLNAYKSGKKFEHYVLGGVYSTWVELSNVAASKLNLKYQVKPLPYPLLKFFSYIVFYFSKLIGKKPHLTPQVADLVGRGQPKFSDYLLQKSKQDLSYDVNSQSLKKMVSDCINWMEVAHEL